MRGVIAMTVLLTYEDAGEIERRAEQKMLSDPGRWPTRTDAILDEVELAARTFIVARGTKVLSVEPAREGDVPHVLPAQITEADVIAGGPGRARRRELHEAYLEELRIEQEEAAGQEDEADDGEDEDPA